MMIKIMIKKLINMSLHNDHHHESEYDYDEIHVFCNINK